MSFMLVLGPGSLGALDVYTKKVRTAHHAGAVAAGLRWLASGLGASVVGGAHFLGVNIHGAQTT